jgi:hypothetical protein
MAGDVRGPGAGGGADYAGGGADGGAMSLESTDLRVRQPIPLAQDLTGDVDLTGDQIAAFCDLVERTQPTQVFDLNRLRAATRISRHPSLQQVEWRVTLDGQRGSVVVPIQGLP